MHILLFLAAAAAAVAVVCRIDQTKKGGEALDPYPAPEKRDPAQGWLEGSAPAEELAALVDALRAVMGHPQLGGPGFLTIQFLEAGPTLTAQFPNIREVLYSRIATGELEGLSGLGLPEELLNRDPVFETESGGMVLISAVIRGAEPLPEGRREREAVLDAISRELRRRYPEMTIQRLGGDILLTPARDERVLHSS